MDSEFDWEVEPLGPLASQSVLYPIGRLQPGYPARYFGGN